MEKAGLLRESRTEGHDASVGIPGIGGPRDGPRPRRLRGIVGRWRDVPTEGSPDERHRRGPGGLAVMRRHKSLSVWGAAVVAALVALGPRSAVAGTLRISGTGGAIGTMRILGEEFHRMYPDTRVEVTPSIGTNGAIKAVLEGDLDVGLATRPTSIEECDRGCMATAYARTPFVFGVNRDVAETGVTVAEVADIYAGRKLRWENGTRLRLVVRPVGESDIDILKGMSPEMSVAVEVALHRQGMIVGMTDQDSADVIERTPGAFGCLTLAIIVSEKRNIRVLALNGVVPGTRTLRDGSYRYAKTFYLVTKRHPPPAVRQFVDFVQSPAARAILSKNGQTAVR